MLARSCARSAPHVLRSGATAAYVSRWSTLLSFAAARAVAASLLSLPLKNAANVDGAALDLSDVLAETFSAPPLASRLPLRATQCVTGRLGVWLPVMPRTGTADWPEKVRQKKEGNVDILLPKLGGLQLPMMQCFHMFSHSTDAILGATACSNQYPQLGLQFHTKIFRKQRRTVECQLGKWPCGPPRNKPQE